MAYLLRHLCRTPHAFGFTFPHREKNMAWDLLFTSDIGLFSLFTIAFILVMALYIARYASKHMQDEESAQHLTNRPSGSH